MAAGPVAGGIAAAVDSFLPSLVPRSTSHQAALLGLSGAVGYGAAAALRGALSVAGTPQLLMGDRRVRAGLLAVAAATALPVAVRRASAEHAAHAAWDRPPMRPLRAAAEGTALAAGLVLGGKAAAAAVRAAARTGSGRIGGPAAAWGAAAVLAEAVAVRLVVPSGAAVVLHRLETAGGAPDPAFAAAPANPHVSGGPGSLVPYATHAREGARFVHLACTADRIEQVTGTPALDPIRVFVGVTAAPTAQQQVALAVAELDRQGAFERSCVLAVSPAGTGYVNAATVEALELLTGGDCATVAIQYGVLPSMFSMGELPRAAEVYRLLLDALQGRARRLFVYGESLGADAAQSALLAAPGLLRTDGSFAGVDAALLAGTPGGAGLRARVPDAGALPRVLLVDRREQVPEPPPDQVRTWLLDHDADPVTKFRRELLWRRPDWLSGPRGRGVPEQMRWRPVFTWLQVALDVAHATQSQVGRFESLGHDYRADLPWLVRAAFAAEAPVELVERVMAQLARSELRRAELLAQR